MLRAIFDHYRQLAGASDDHFLDLPEWTELINEAKLYHKYFTVKEAKFGFIWSRMVWIDDCSTNKAYSRSVSGSVD